MRPICTMLGGNDVASAILRLALTIKRKGRSMFFGKTKTLCKSGMRPPDREDERGVAQTL